MFRVFLLVGVLLGLESKRVLAKLDKEEQAQKQGRSQK